MTWKDAVVAEAGVLRLSPWGVSGDNRTWKGRRVRGKGYRTMKKRTALTMLTSCMMVAATAGTYAQWDKVTDSTTGSIGLSKPVILDASSTTMENNDKSRTVGQLATASGTATFTLQDEKSKVKSLKITPEVTSTQGGATTNDFEITIKDGNNPSASLSGGVYEDVTLSEANNYTVELKPIVKESAETLGNGKTIEEWNKVGTLNVTLKGELVGKESAELSQVQ